MSKTKVRAVAFYLPQYHPIPENDKWWGKGFTEWTSVKRAKPLFDGHYQPQVPDDEIGYYDLRDASIREKQAQLANAHGIYGFCYYHYWFGGKKLLETPLQGVLKTGKPDFPFCVCWANENWSRRWDGQEAEILMAQNHSDEDDRAFIMDLVPVFKDPRYIRVNGKPLLIIYRTEFFPDIKRSAQIWRNAMMDAGVGEIYLVRVEGYSAPVDPQIINFDAAIEFAPDWQNVGKSVNVNRKSRKYRDISQDLFNHDTLSVYDYEISMLRMLAKQVPEYKLFRGVYPEWDNTPRRKTSATVFINSGPDNFEYFLKRQLQYTYEHYSGDERMLFINAWNEWGEGCHLEPDARRGRAYLEVCRKLLAMPEESILEKKVLQRQIDNLELYISECTEEVSKLRCAMDELNYWKASKFWKMRDLYMKLKYVLFLWKRK